MDRTLLDECILNCQECFAACSALIPHCLSKGGRYATNAHIGLLQDAAKICSTALEFMLRESPRHDLTCGACAAICVQCADECEQLAGGDRQMLECAEICRECANSCNLMSSTLRSVAYVR